MKVSNFDINADYELILDTSIYIKFDKYLREDFVGIINFNKREE